jgi:hypothetical protein
VAAGGKGDVMRALRRKEIIEAWQKNPRFLEDFCCPECRDILVENSYGNLECINQTCDNKKKYNKNTGELV